MITKGQWRSFIDHPVVEWTIFVVGLLLLFVVAPLVGALPGPGGVVVAGIGLAMVLKTSMWAKRRYVRFKRWKPKAGGWADWALRRRSARRRLKLQKEREKAGVAPSSSTGEDRLEDLIPDPPHTPPETWANRVGRANRRRSGD
jgi:hypothetical protein